MDPEHVRGRLAPLLLIEVGLQRHQQFRLAREALQQRVQVAQHVVGSADALIDRDVGVQVHLPAGVAAHPELECLEGLVHGSGPTGGSLVHQADTDGLDLRERPYQGERVLEQAAIGRHQGVAPDTGRPDDQSLPVQHPDQVFM